MPEGIDHTQYIPAGKIQHTNGRLVTVDASELDLEDLLITQDGGMSGVYTIDCQQYLIPTCDVPFLEDTQTPEEVAEVEDMCLKSAQKISEAEFAALGTAARGQSATPRQPAVYRIVKAAEQSYTDCTVLELVTDAEQRNYLLQKAARQLNDKGQDFDDSQRREEAS